MISISLDCWGLWKSRKENGVKECSDGGTHNGTYDAVILEKGVRSRAVRSYAVVTREDLKTPLGQDILIISEIIYFIKVFVH